MTPKISVRPAAIKNSITPNCSPFSTCSIKRSVVISPRPHVTHKKTPDNPAGGLCYKLQLAVGCIDVLTVFQRQLEDLVGVNIPVLDHFTDIKVLNRVLVVAEFEISTSGGKISL